MILSKVLKEWDELPDDMKNDRVREYYDLLYKKRYSLLLKRIFDFTMGTIALIILFPLFLIIAIAIKVDSKGPVLFRQVRVTQYGKSFWICKFRTMVQDAEKFGSQVTVKDDVRVTKVGRFLRGYRLDEIPQILNIIRGDMSFVGVRPEVVKYVEKYNEEMKATLLLPSGVTSEASIEFKDEEKLLTGVKDVDHAYVEKILPQKMEFNLQHLKNFSLIEEFKTIFRTVFAVSKANSEEEDYS